MIQRVQTLFLIGIIICMALEMSMPIWEKSNTEKGITYTLDAFYWREFTTTKEPGAQPQLMVEKTVIYLAVLCIASALVALYSIFQYRRRMFQMKLGALNAFLMMALIAAATYLIYNGENAIGSSEKGAFRIGYFLPLAAMIMNSLANRFIKRDENLVKSVDRIR
ncbi:MAG: DUF4293 domain-containing protein [Cyclobacteriaceae bacterium]|nr:DUF4293 domain-containing protein [Cyclobacteriaceae bacterium]